MISMVKHFKSEKIHQTVNFAFIWEISEYVQVQINTSKKGSLFKIELSYLQNLINGSLVTVM